MPTGYHRARTFFSGIVKKTGIDELATRLRPKVGNLPPSLPMHEEVTAEAVGKRWDILKGSPEARANLLDSQTLEQMSAYKHNVENFIGTAKIPIGVAGPLRVNGIFAQGDYYVPMATTEAALVASYNRGAHIISESGGASVMLLNEGVSRAPVFVFENLEDLGRFVNWTIENEPEIRRQAEATTGYGKLVDMGMTIEGATVYFSFTYETGDASGQNIVTIATFAAVLWMTEHAPVKPRSVFLEANSSGDKKATAQSMQNVRGKKVTAEVIIPADVIQRRLHTTAERIVEYYQLTVVGAAISGTIGIQGHYANGLAALFIACGQDAACVSEAAIGNTAFLPREDGKLQVSVTLPNMIVGTVGGGTALPSQKSCLELLGMTGAGKARAFAEVAAALCLAGEISITGAMAAGEFAQAHARLARGKTV